MGKKVQTDNRSQLGKNIKAADNVYLGETNVSVGYLVYFVIFFTTLTISNNNKYQKGVFHHRVYRDP
jgi:hypothetical protein